MFRTFLKESEWKIIQPLLPSQVGKKGRPRKDDRLVIEGIIWILRTGAPWRDLPPEAGNWKTVYWRFHYWMEKGIWDQIWQVLKKRWKSRISYH